MLCRKFELIPTKNCGVMSTVDPLHQLILSVFYFILLGNTGVSLWRYLVDSRSIPVVGEEDNGVETIPTTASFSIKNGDLSFTVNGAKAVQLGTHVQYRVTELN